MRDNFYAEHGKPWDDKFTPDPATQRAFKEDLDWYEQHYNNFSDAGFSDFALMSSGGGLFEGTGKVWDQAQLV